MPTIDELMANGRRIHDQAGELFRDLAPAKPHERVAIALALLCYSIQAAHDSKSVRLATAETVMQSLGLALALGELPEDLRP